MADMTQSGQSDVERAEREHVAKGGTPGWSREAMEESAARRLDARAAKALTGRQAGGRQVMASGQGDRVRQAELECAFDYLDGRDLEVLVEALARAGGERATELRDAIRSELKHRRAAGVYAGPALLIRARAKFRRLR